MAYTSISYTNQLGTRRGFKLHHTRKFSVLRLRARILCFFRILTRWSHQTLTAIKRRISRRRRRDNRFPCCRMNYKVENQFSRDRLKSFARSNSFYTEAIKECLEFIKRTSVSSVDEYDDEDHRIQKNGRSSSRLID